MAGKGLPRWSIGSLRCLASLAWRSGGVVGWLVADVGRGEGGRGADVGRGLRSLEKDVVMVVVGVVR